MFGLWRLRPRDATASRYVDERFRSIEREIAAIEPRIERQITALTDKHNTEIAEVTHRADNEASRLETLISLNNTRINNIESTLDRQRGMQAALAGLAAIAGVLVTIFLLIAAHIHIT